MYHRVWHWKKNIVLWQFLDYSELHWTDRWSKWKLAMFSVMYELNLPIFRSLFLYVNKIHFTLRKVNVFYVFWVRLHGVHNGMQCREKQMPVCLLVCFFFTSVEHISIEFCVGGVQAAVVIWIEIWFSCACCNTFTYSAHLSFYKNGSLLRNIKYWDEH
jgi:hypothetical protein